MGKVIESVYAILYFVLLTTGGGYAVQKAGQEIKKAAITKAAHGLPSLPRFKTH